MLAVFLILSFICKRPCSPLSANLLVAFTHAYNADPSDLFSPLATSIDRWTGHGQDTHTHTYTHTYTHTHTHKHTHTYAYTHTNTHTHTHTHTRTHTHTHTAPSFIYPCLWSFAPLFCFGLFHTSAALNRGPLRRSSLTLPPLHLTVR